MTAGMTAEWYRKTASDEKLVQKSRGDDLKGNWVSTRCQDESTQSRRIVARLLTFLCMRLVQLLILEHLHLPLLLVL